MPAGGLCSRTHFGAQPFKASASFCCLGADASDRLVQTNSTNAEAVSDSRAVQFWDKSHLVASQVKQQLQKFHENDPSCCEQRGHLFDMAAVYPPGVKWGEAVPAYDDGPVYRIGPALEQRISTTPAESQ